MLCSTSQSGHFALLFFPSFFPSFYFTFLSVLHCLSPLCLECVLKTTFLTKHTNGAYLYKAVCCLRFRFCLSFPEGCPSIFYKSHLSLAVKQLNQLLQQVPLRLFDHSRCIFSAFVSSPSSLFSHVSPRSRCFCFKLPFILFAFLFWTYFCSFFPGFKVHFYLLEHYITFYLLSHTQKKDCRMWSFHLFRML